MTMPSMQEIELKFQIPQEALAALKAELASLPGGDAPPQKLQAAYFDTADRKLAKARAALRVRQEDADWVQTLKAAGANAMTRVEDNQAARAFGPDEAITPDLSLHQTAEVRQALMRDLGWQPESDPQGRQLGLCLLYRTDMLRTRARIELASPAQPSRAGVVEIALDLGRIAAGSLCVPVQELEIELVSGHPRAVLDAARDLIERHGLWLDTQTKAHRGDQLAREAASGQPSPLPPSRPRTRVRPPAASAKARWLAALDAALEHIGANASEVALVDGQALSGGAARPPQRDLRPWIKGWALGLRRLAWVWRHAPRESGHEPQPAHLVTAGCIQVLLGRLRPAPGHYLDPAAAVALARSSSATTLALDVLEQIVAAE